MPQGPRNGDHIGHETKILLFSQSSQKYIRRYNTEMNLKMEIKKKITVKLNPFLPRNP